MEHTKLALSAVMIVAVGLVGTNFVTGLEMTPDNGMSTFEGSSAIYGHVTTIHTDSSGQILSYTQGDNIVVEEGKDCIIENLFGNTAGGDCNAVATNGLFTFIGLTNSTVEAPISSTNATQANGLVGRDLCCDGLGAQIATGFVFTPADAITGAKMAISKTFTATTDTNPVDGAILYNDTVDVVFSTQKFASVTLNTDDTLAVTWTITLG